MVRVKLCLNNVHWSEYTRFYVENRLDIIPGYQVKNALIDVKNTIRNGRGALLIDETDATIGIGSFVLGLEERRFERKEIAVLGNSVFTDKHRCSRTFIRGLQVLAEQIKDMNPEVAEVRIPTAAGNAYTNRLYGKFAVRIDSRHTPYGRIHIYSTPFDEFAAFCGRFRSAPAELAGAEAETIA